MAARRRAAKKAPKKKTASRKSTGFASPLAGLANVQARPRTKARGLSRYFTEGEGKLVVEGLLIMRANNCPFPQCAEELNARGLKNSKGEPLTERQLYQLYGTLKKIELAPE